MRRRDFVRRSIAHRHDGERPSAAEGEGPPIGRRRHCKSSHRTHRGWRAALLSRLLRAASTTGICQEGQNLQITRYSGEGQSERFDDMVTDVVNLKPDAIFVTSTRLLFMLKRATTTIPMVGLMGDPIRYGLVASMARPGGNIAGVSVDPGMEFYDKRYELLKEAVPKAAKLGILVSRFFMEKTADGGATREAAGRAGIELILPTIEALYWRDDDYRVAFARNGREKALTGSSWLQWSKTGHTADRLSRWQKSFGCQQSTRTASSSNLGE